ncbi:hypothetical protein GCM10022383_27500 [Microbacterium soli]|uniref:Uncharacterized protein n=1 Tax=Microbacterium soli TaxID=446075 RepID=A0ABP7NL06_9MICO
MLLTEVRALDGDIVRAAVEFEVAGHVAEPTEGAMISRVGEPGQRTGEFRVRAQGTDGDQPLRTGSALVVIQYASLLLTVLCLVVVWVSMRANGVLLLATIFCAVFAWSCSGRRARR